MDNLLELIVGQEDPIDVFFVKKDGSVEVLDDISSATFYVRPSITGTPIIAKNVLDIEFDITDGKMVVTLSAAEADALVPGLYIGQAAVRQNTNWLFTNWFQVKIHPAIAEQVI